MKNLEKRIKKLERLCGWYRNLFILTGLMLVALMTYGAIKPVPEIIEARTFRVVSKQGRPMGIFTAQEDFGSVVLITDSKIIPSSGVSLGGFGLTVYSKEYLLPDKKEVGHKSLVEIGVQPETDGFAFHGGIVFVSNKTGDSAAQMYVDEYGNGVVGAYNRKGKGRTLQPGP